MKTILIAGSGSDVGKTSLACRIFGILPDWSALKVTVKSEGRCPRGRSCSVCDQIKVPFCIITEDRVINQEGKDTSRLREAGAKQVVWLQASPAGLRPGLREAFASFEDTEGIVIEGTSVLRYHTPDLTIYIEKEKGQIKPTSKEAKEKADIIIRC